MHLARLLFFSAAISIPALAQGKITVETSTGKVEVSNAPRAVEAATSYLIEGQGRSETHTCQPNEEVNISGQGHVVTLSGPCRKVLVSGQGHTVSVETVGSIEVSGMGSNVTWRTALSGRKPTIRSTGMGNSVKQLR